MDSTPVVSRRTFLGAAAAALFAGIAIQITGCGTEEDSGAGAGDSQGSVSDNHGHKAVVTKAQIDAAGAITLSIQGSADHTHNLDITAAEMVDLKAKKHVMKTSSATAGHSHTVMFN